MTAVRALSLGAALLAAGSGVAPRLSNGPVPQVVLGAQDLWEG